MWKLILLPGGPKQVGHELTEEHVTIGRSADNLIQIDDPSVATRHAELHRVGEIFHLQDLGSMNSTYVNSEAVTSVALRPGDQIRFGKVEACFDRERADETRPLPEAVHRPAPFSARPAGFANASPFTKRKREKDPVRVALFAAAAVAILAFLGSLLALAQMRPPVIP